MLALRVPYHADQYRGNEAGNCGDQERPAPDFARAALSDQMVGTDTQNEKGPSGQTREKDVGELLPDVGIAQQRPKVYHLGPAVAQDIADGLLHERIGNEDPQSREIGANGHGPHDRRVHGFGQFVPAKDPDAQEGGLHKEGQQALNGQGRAKDITHEARVLGPVHTKLELHDDARYHAHGKVDEEELSPELDHFLVDLIPGADIHGFHDGQQDSEAQCEGHEEKVVDRGSRKLHSRQRQCTHTSFLLGKTPVLR